MYRNIGEFIFEFSQLEEIIRGQLRLALKLKDEHSNAVLAPYDFATLCNVAKTILSIEYPHKVEQIGTLFNKCLTLNTERVRIVHGLWTVDETGSRAQHIVRSTWKEKLYFADSKELPRLAANAARYRREVFFTIGGGKGPIEFDIEVVGGEPPFPPNPKPPDSSS
jgi:hypothetical protein